MMFSPGKLATPRGELVLRVATPDDWEQFAALRLLALRTAPEAFGSSYENTKDRTPQQWRDSMAARGVIAILDNGDEFVGMAGLFREEGLKTQHKATIWGVFVRPEWRGLRLADAILQQLLQVARDLPGLRKVELAVITTNTPALSIYERLGFRIYGTAPEELYVDGRYYDEHLMVLMLGS